MAETVKPGDEVFLYRPGDVAHCSFFFQVPQFPDGFSYLEHEVWGSMVGFWSEAGGIKIWWWWQIHDL